MLRKVIEILLLAPATLTFGLAAVIGFYPLLITLLFGTWRDARDAEHISLGINVILIVLAMSAILGLAALWTLVIGGKGALSATHCRRSLLLAGTIVGMIGAGGMLYVTFANDGFDVITTTTNNAYWLYPLIGPIIVGARYLPALISPGAAREAG